LQTDRVFAHYLPEQNPPRLGPLALELLEQQKGIWPQLREGYRALASVQVRELQIHDFTVRLQFNPKRLASSGANVDAQSLQARPCFLCLENLPAPQQGILYGEDFLVLGNPAPIFAQHYTISHVRHQPQELAGHVETLLKLAKDFSPQFSVFYNGPRCGASAPDHLHFQASPAGAIPLESQMHHASHRVLVKNVQGVSLHEIQRLERRILLFTGFEEQAMRRALLHAFAAMKAAMHSEGEPMMNVIAAFRDDLYQVLIFPRRQHRPAVYFREGEERILISPASVDMGGLIITPVEKDFLRVTPELIAQVYREVTINAETLQQVIAKI